MAVQNVNATVLEKIGNFYAFKVKQTYKEYKNANKL